MGSVIVPGTRAQNFCFPAFVPAAPFAWKALVSLHLLLLWSPSQQVNRLHGVEARDLDGIRGLPLSLTPHPFIQLFPRAVSLIDLSAIPSRYSYGDA